MSRCRTHAQTLPLRSVSCLTSTAPTSTLLGVVRHPTQSFSHDERVIGRAAPELRWQANQSGKSSTSPLSAMRLSASTSLASIHLRAMARWRAVIPVGLAQRSTGAPSGLFVTSSLGLIMTTGSHQPVRPTNSSVSNAMQFAAAICAHSRSSSGHGHHPAEQHPDSRQLSLVHFGQGRGRQLAASQ